jgi:hypothetical protein
MKDVRITGQVFLMDSITNNEKEKKDDHAYENDMGSNILFRCLFMDRKDLWEPQRIAS